ncbi:MAG: M16 family metallopeptidase [Saprospiraceae bacterium]
MIEYKRFQLSNGLRVIVHEDNSTPMVAFDMLYDVGARDESPEQTGFAHLFEHLMFAGSANVPDYDDQIQLAGGENNAYTTNDNTNFYSVVPAANLELIFWLESDRMMSLNINENSLDVQRKVVVEEFKETCLNQPYGDSSHHIAALAYKVHPYRWPTIGLVPQHIEEATLEDVSSFYKRFYQPNNAVLSIAGNVTVKEVKTLCKKWFSDIPSVKLPKRKLPQEPPQQKPNKLIRHNNVPADALFFAFHVPARNEPDYYVVDLLSDLLANGGSSRLYRRLQKEQKLFNQIDAYVTGSIDPGLLIIEGRPMDGVSLEEAETAVWKELEELKNITIQLQELKKLQNKAESTLIFSETSILNKALNLAYFEALEKPELINEEVNLYNRITTEDMQRMAQAIFLEENCSVVFYKKEGKVEEG